MVEGLVTWRACGRVPPGAGGGGVELVPGGVSG